MDFPVINLDIIYRIIYWSAKDAGENLKEWKSALPLLGVCSSWRQAGLKRLYSTIFLTGANIDGQFYRPNYTLIMDNGYGSLVKRMVDPDDYWDNATMEVIRIVGATESSCPGIDKFMEDRPECISDDDEDHEDGYRFCLCTSYDIYREYHLVNVECPNQVYHENAGYIQPRLADMLKEKLPNITAFCIQQAWMPYPLVNIFLDILKIYESQITSLEYDGPELGIELESPNLRSFGYSYNTYYENYEMFEISNPELIRKIKVRDWSSGFDYILDNCDAVEVVHMFDETANNFQQKFSLDKVKSEFPNIKFVILKDASYVFDGGNWHEL
ncbi:hypothetical protein BX667DRAFT_508680 [Coemansia mojavensis]|nr:hypothetical protein BX667DRAFT_508680 [Coemansia mojavensis]